MEFANDEVISTCVRFSRMVSEAREPEAILEMLARAAVEHLGADAALVLRVMEQGGGMQLAATHGVPEGTRELRLAAETIGQELEGQMVEACGRRFARARTVPLVSGRNLYGALVMLFVEEERLEGFRVGLARGLADLGAVALDQAFHRVTLERTLAEVRASRELMARTERLRALGEMSAGVAHDLRNIFSPLALQLDLLRRRTEDTKTVLRVADALERVVKRGVETVERLRLFGHQSMKAEVAVSDLDVLVDETLALCRPRLTQCQERRILLVREHGGPVRVRVRSVEVVTSLMNLVFNAVEAMPEGGTLTVRTGSGDGEGWLRVSDTGVGMSREVKEHLFEPFFTTKGEAGTGLGLSMVDAFVKRSGGAIDVVSEPGRGATFTLRFPLERQEQPSSQAVLQ